MFSTLRRSEPSDFPSGTYGLRYGLAVVIQDSATPMEQLQKTGKCRYSKLSANTCQCWSCRGLSSNPTSPEQRTPRKP